MNQIDPLPPSPAALCGKRPSKVREQNPVNVFKNVRKVNLDWFYYNFPDFHFTLKIANCMTLFYGHGSPTSKLLDH